MINECENCGGNISFSPKDKGLLCESCGSVFPIKYDFNIKKNEFEQAKVLNSKESDQSVQSFKCNSCGANIVLNKKDIKSSCPYCGSCSIAENNKSKLLNIDAIIPFSFAKKDALTIFQERVNKSFYANKKIFKNLKQDELKGIYVNAFVFDLNTNVQYDGVFSYTTTVRNSKGESKSVVRYKNVKGVFDKFFNNITIEANSNLNQNEMNQILPYDYSKAVNFDVNFTQGYSLEHHNEMFEDCFARAESIIKNQIKKDLLKKYNCERVESLKLNINYTDRKYNYCLLPVYFVNKKYKEKNYNVLMNGQTGALSSLPKSVGKILLTVFMVLGIVAGIVALVMLMI